VLIENKFHYTDWKKAVGLLLVHLIGMFGIIYLVHFFSWPILLATIGYFFLCHLAITVGAHRYFTHQSFTAKPWFAKALAIFFSGTLQGPLYWWVIKHLQHHGNEDVPGKDPHNPRDGFWHAHVLWLLTSEAKLLPPAYVQTLRKNEQKPDVRVDTIHWQRKYHGVLSITMGFIVPGLIGFLLGDAVAGVLVMGFTRLVFQYHLTWSINSVGHTFGTRIDASARNFGWFLTPVIGLLTVGESHHANHHVSPGHWRLGRSRWQFDPGAWLLLIGRACGFVSGLREPPNRRGRQVLA
jgi:stearoyl-CoA desaturase (delta-9 desaturase)